jgi:DNA replication licensing factor MCM6
MELPCGSNMLHGYKLRLYLGESKSRVLFCVLLRYKEDGKIKYLYGAEELRSPEKSTLEVCFEDVEKYNQNLAATIIEEYYR